MVPNSRPVSQIASAQPLSSRSVCVRVGVGAEVEVVAEPAEQRVAHRTADQVQLVAGGGEAAAQLVGDRGDAEQFGDGVALGGGEFAAVGGVGAEASDIGSPAYRARTSAIAVAPGAGTSAPEVD